MDPEEQRRQTERIAYLDMVADMIILDLIDMYAEGEDLSRRASLEKRMMGKYRISAKDAMYCFRRLEMKHPEELSSMSYRSFPRWNLDPKYPTGPKFQNKFSRPSPR